jgi:YfiH family protein
MPSERLDQEAGPPLSGLTIDWPAPPGVRAFMSTRQGGESAAPFDSFNLGAHVGDHPLAVQRNRQRFSAALGATPVWLRQVHGAQVIDACDAAAADQAADAAFSTTAGVACAVLVADCMPVLFALRNGGAVAAAHAGWRGLAAGVLENTVAALCGAARAAPQDVMAWMGPCIGPQNFEVGDEVRAAFGGRDAPCFVAHRRADGTAAWLADLPALARARLQRAGVAQVYGGHWCTVEQRSDFFSFRRDRITGRMAAAIVRLR